MVKATGGGRLALTSARRGMSGTPSVGASLAQKNPAASQRRGSLQDPISISQSNPFGDQPDFLQSSRMLEDLPAWRRGLVRMVTSKVFETIVLILILANCVTLAMQDPLQSPHSEWNRRLDIADFVLLLFFTLEMILKILAFGLFKKRHGYLRSWWNVLDAVIVVSGWLVYAIEGFPFGDTAGVGMGEGNDTPLSFFRALRVLRPLRTVTGTVESVLWSEGAGGGTGFLIPYAGKHPDGPSLLLHSLRNHRHADTGENPNMGFISFDDFLASNLLIFQAITLEGWGDLETAFKKGAGIVATLYFSLVISFGGLFLVNLTLAVIKTAFTDSFSHNLERELEEIWRMQEEADARMKEMEDDLEDGGDEEGEEDEEEEDNNLNGEGEAEGERGSPRAASPNNNKDKQEPEGPSSASLALLAASGNGDFASSGSNSGNATVQPLSDRPTSTRGPRTLTRQSDVTRQSEWSDEDWLEREPRHPSPYIERDRSREIRKPSHLSGIGQEGDRHKEEEEEEPTSTSPKGLTPGEANARLSVSFDPAASTNKVGVASQGSLGRGRTVRIVSPGHSMNPESDTAKEVAQSQSAVGKSHPGLKVPDRKNSQGSHSGSEEDSLNEVNAEVGRSIQSVYKDRLQTLRSTGSGAVHESHISLPDMVDPNRRRTATNLRSQQTTTKGQAARSATMRRRFSASEIDTIKRSKYTLASQRTSLMAEEKTTRCFCYECFDNIVLKMRGRMGKGDNCSACIFKTWELNQRLVDSPWFDNFMTVMVFFNTVILAIYFYGMPKDLERGLDIANFAFTVIFTLEAALKLLRHGLNYFLNPLNVFDFVIVCLAWIEMGIAGSMYTSSQGTSLSAFRALRLFRVFRVLKAARLLRRLKAMRTIADVISRSVWTFAYIGILLLLFLFIFALLGMQLFGGKFDFDGEGPPYANFDSFHRSILACFQLITLENWNGILIDGMRAVGPAAALYFVLWIFLGNFVLLNLFLAVILDSFDAEASDAVRRREGTDDSSDSLDRSEGTSSRSSGSVNSRKLSAMITQRTLNKLQSMRTRMTLASQESVNINQSLQLSANQSVKLVNQSGKLKNGDADRENDRRDSGRTSFIRDYDRRDSEKASIRSVGGRDDEKRDSAKTSILSEEERRANVKASINRSTTAAIAAAAGQAGATPIPRKVMLAIVEKGSGFFTAAGTPATPKRDIFGTPKTIKSTPRQLPRKDWSGTPRKDWSGTPRKDWSITPRMKGLETPRTAFEDTPQSRNDSENDDHGNGPKPVQWPKSPSFVSKKSTRNNLGLETPKTAFQDTPHHGPRENDGPDYPSEDPHAPSGPPLLYRKKSNLKGGQNMSQFLPPRTPSVKSVERKVSIKETNDTKLEEEWPDESQPELYKNSHCTIINTNWGDLCIPHCVPLEDIQEEPAVFAPQANRQISRSPSIASYRSVDEDPGLHLSSHKPMQVHHRDSLALTVLTDSDINPKSESGSAISISDDPSPKGGLEGQRQTSPTGRRGSQQIAGQPPGAACPRPIQSIPPTSFFFPANGSSPRVDLNSSVALNASAAANVSALNISALEKSDTVLAKTAWKAGVGTATTNTGRGWTLTDEAQVGPTWTGLARGNSDLGWKAFDSTTQLGQDRTVEDLDGSDMDGSERVAVQDDPAPAWERLLNSSSPKALFLLSPTNPVRIFCARIVTHKIFERFILLIIVLTCIKLALDTYLLPAPPRYSPVFIPFDETNQTAAASESPLPDPSVHNPGVTQRWPEEEEMNGRTVFVIYDPVAPDPQLVSISEMFDFIFFGAFALEMLLKILASGLVRTKGAYLRSGWNILDGSLVAITAVDLGIRFSPLVSADAAGDQLRAVQVLRLARALRPLRVISRRAGMRLVVDSLFFSIAAIANVVAVTLFIWLMFAILGVSVFGGGYRQCSDPNIQVQSECVGLWLDTQTGTYRERRWEVSLLNMDSVPAAMLTLFVASSLDNWPDIMEKGESTAGALGAYYWIFFVLVSAFFFLNLFVGVMFQRFQIEKHKLNSGRGAFMTDAQLAMYYYDAPPEYIRTLELCGVVLSLLFFVEAVVKNVALTPKVYFADGWNVFDFFLVCGSIVDLTFFFVFQDASGSQAAQANSSIVNILRIFRVVRLMRLVRRFEGLRKILWTLVFSLPSLLNVASLVLLIMFVYAVLGVFLFRRVSATQQHMQQHPMQHSNTWLIMFVYAVLGVFLFRRVRYGNALNEDTNFDNFLNALLLLMKIATGENWSSFMEDAAVSPPDCTLAVDCGLPEVSFVYFISFIVFCSFIFLNFFILIIIEQFEQTEDQTEETLAIIANLSDQVKEFKKIWSTEYDPKFTQVIPVESLLRLLASIGAPLGLKEVAERSRGLFLSYFLSAAPVRDRLWEKGRLSINRLEEYLAAMIISDFVRRNKEAREARKSDSATQPGLNATLGHSRSKVVTSRVGTVTDCLSRSLAMSRSKTGLGAFKSMGATTHRRQSRASEMTAAVNMEETGDVMALIDGVAAWNPSRIHGHEFPKTPPIPRGGAAMAVEEVRGLRLQRQKLNGLGDLRGECATNIVTPDILTEPAGPLERCASPEALKEADVLLWGGELSDPKTHRDTALGARALREEALRCMAREPAGLAAILAQDGGVPGGGGGAPAGRRTSVGSVSSEPGEIPTAEKRRGSRTAAVLFGKPKAAAAGSATLSQTNVDHMARTKTSGLGLLLCTVNDRDKAALKIQQQENKERQREREREEERLGIKEEHVSDGKDEKDEGEKEQIPPQEMQKEFSKGKRRASREEPSGRVSRYAELRVSGDKKERVKVISAQIHESHKQEDESPHRKEKTKQNDEGEGKEPAKMPELEKETSNRRISSSQVSALSAGFFDKDDKEKSWKGDSSTLARSKAAETRRVLAVLAQSKWQSTSPLPQLVQLPAKSGAHPTTGAIAHGGAAPVAQNAPGSPPFSTPPVNSMGMRPLRSKTGSASGSVSPSAAAAFRKSTAGRGSGEDNKERTPPSGSDQRSASGSQRSGSRSGSPTPPKSPSPSRSPWSKGRSRAGSVLSPPLLGYPLSPAREGSDNRKGSLSPTPSSRTVTGNSPGHQQSRGASACHTPVRRTATDAAALLGQLREAREVLRRKKTQKRALTKQLTRTATKHGGGLNTSPSREPSPPT
uniref:Ion transport domain-containing protein n=1 Tax=Chromera velia CCMP2878 TaxID=1169474 RepID=A0A0G4H4M4_9ALVE|eukprot:Cvel_850.t1-p1 / transcript=Cvel_850.t1 / gene=Cvel_850 / organism=Chromera_velia_CCMP2878 / gene_product=Voltage-dependent L-type calcium channel subunit, putative / transcript_product=Voltage-dependent L-type calcium channel subunit, putative / location=Cvel_scaffold26:123973-145203(+) / protein_length=3134 / sequence_SO=supercontig / SO=protein_coding / is_pseudo=false